MKGHLKKVLNQIKKNQVKNLETVFKTLTDKEKLKEVVKKVN